MTAPSLWRRIRNTFFNPRRRHIAAIDVTADGFVLSLRAREKPMRWADVTQIDAGVRDYLSYDALYVVMMAGAAAIEIQELDDGFRLFEHALVERWPHIREVLNRLLVSTPHEPQHETLWRR